MIAIHNQDVPYVPRRFTKEEAEIYRKLMFYESTIYQLKQILKHCAKHRSKHSLVMRMLGPLVLRVTQLESRLKELGNDKDS